jgi:hypothetical protein
MRTAHIGASSVCRDPCRARDQMHDTDDAGAATYMTPTKILLRFDHPGEWKKRQAWQNRLDIRQHPIEAIIGGYDLHRDLWLPCGLKGCGTTHGKGYVVVTKDAIETHLGQDCGRRHVGADFVEMERLFKRDLDQQDRMKRLTDVLKRKDALLAEAKAAVIACETKQQAVNSIVQDISHETALAAAFRSALHDSGRLHYERAATKGERELRQGAKGPDRFIRVQAGRIDGVEAAITRSPSIAMRELIPALLRLTPEILSELTEKSLITASRDADAMTTALNESRSFVALCDRFIDVRNWQAFTALFEPGRLRANDRGRRILQRLVSD